MLKHAYLIMIHEYTLVLERLIQLLDHENNGIYIHIDKNAAGIGREEIEKIQRLPEKSDIALYRRYRVFWGTGSIMKAQIFLLASAVGRGYDYYHFLSGADLPVKSQETIQEFFENNNGKEFIHFGTAQYQHDIIGRYNVYHFFSRQLGRKRDRKFWVSAETYSLAVQRRLHIDRTKRLGFGVYGGANWFSITGALAQYVVKNYKKYAKTFRFSQNSDEAVMQTIVMDSPFRENLYRKGMDNDYTACVRYIDWDRGSPYVFCAGDFGDLMSSEYMFARKFDENRDREIVEMIYHALGEQDGT